MKTRNKKGFTIVELVIVIAVIGILTAILVPVFINLTNKANEASDNSLVKNLNTALRMEEQTAGHKKAPTLQGAIDDLENQGYLLENLQSKSGLDLLWDQEDNQFLLNKDGVAGAKYWKIVDTLPGLDQQVYSYYAGQHFSANAVANVKYGFDAGDNEGIEKVTFENKGAAREGTIAIRTNGGTLTVNAPLDTVKHYGEAQVVTLTAVGTSSYYEHGSVNLVDIKKGRLVITNDAEAEVGTIYLTATADAYDNIILATQSESTLPEVVARESVSNPTTGEKLVVTIQTNVNENGENPTKTEEIKLYPESDVKEATNGYNVSDLGLLVVEAISSEAQTQAAEQITNEEVLEAVKETKTATIEDTITAAVKFAGGKGTQEKPYLIATAQHWNNFYQAVYDFNKEDKVAYFELANNIDLTGFEIANYAIDGEDTIYNHYMNFSLDGKDKSIIGISQLGGYQQPFPYLNDATIKNITINYNLVNMSKTLAMTYDTKGDCYFVNVTTTGELSTKADWATAFVAYAHNGGNIYYTNCSNMANLSASFGADGYVAPFGSHNGGGVHITFDKCTNYGVIMGNHVGFVGMGNDSAYTFVDTNAVKNFGKMYGANCGYFNFGNADTIKTISGVTCEVKQTSASLNAAAKHTNSVPANYGDKIYVDAIEGATVYQVEMRFAIGVYDYNSTNLANKWGGGFPRAFSLMFSNADVVDGKIDTGLYKAYICETQQDSYNGYHGTTPSYTGIWTPSGFDEEIKKYWDGDDSAVTVLSGNDDDIYLVEYNGNIFYYYNDFYYPTWYTLLSSDAQSNPETKGLTITYTITAYTANGDVLSQATLSDTFTAAQARTALGGNN